MRITKYMTAKVFVLIKGKEYLFQEDKNGDFKG